MVDKTPAGITAGNANDESVVHASDADLGNLSRSHKERDISRLQAAILPYDPTKTYDLGDLVSESGLTYINIIAIAVPEAFDINKWQFTDNGLGIILVSYNTDPSGDGEFFVINGGDAQGIGSEVNAQAPVAADFTLTRMTLQVQANSRDQLTEWHFRKNGADGNQIITIPAGVTGNFQDLVNTDDMVVGDLINYQIREIGGTGTVTVIGSSIITRRTEV